MKTIKLTTPWQLPYLDQSPGGKGIWDGYRFCINDDCDEADYWIVWGWEPKPQRVRVPRNHVVYLTDEAHEQRHYHPGYLGQFARVATPRKDITGNNVVAYQEIAPWYLPATWEDLAEMPVPAKEARQLSLISSSLVHLPGHLKRFAFLNQLRGHFKDRLHVFGRGIRPVDDKREAFFPYPYSVALENSAIPDYFTEKIREIWLGYGFPFYWGCPNLADYFDADAFVALDIDDLKTSVEQIEYAIGHDYWNSRFDLICEARHKVLHTYHLFPALVRLVEALPEAGKVEDVRIRPEKKYWAADQHPARQWARAALRALGR